MKRARLSLFYFFAFATCGLSSALAFDETVEVPSLTLTDAHFVNADVNAGKAVKLTGNLVGPDNGSPSPVVVLLHGGDGPTSGAVWNWSRYLNGVGIATFSLDSYTGRGFEHAPANSSLFGQFTQIYDAYRAVEVLARNPKVDGSRVVLMGFSRGGNTALYSAMMRFQKAFGPSKGKIVAHIAFYPYCNFELADQFDIGAVPLREFHGAEDDQSPVASCQNYIESLAGAGHDAEMTVYPGALHAFDDPRRPARVADDEWLTARNCKIQEKNRQLVNKATGKPFAFTDACVEHGASVQYNDQAATAAQSSVRSFLTEVFEQK